MALRKKLLEITYHADDDTGMYEIDELDFGLLVEEIKAYCERNKTGRADISNLLKWLADKIKSGDLGTK